MSNQLLTLEQVKQTHPVACHYLIKAAEFYKAAIYAVGADTLSQFTDQSSSNIEDELNDLAAQLKYGKELLMTTLFPTSTKILFLDMDGVINSADESQPIIHDPDLYQRNLVDVLNMLSEGFPDVKVVLSSTWRLTYNTPEKVNALFKEIGINFECIGITPSNGYCRGQEIEQWINKHVENPHQYKKYVIVDDDSDMLYNQRFNFVRTNAEVGITKRNIWDMFIIFVER